MKRAPSAAPPLLQERDPPRQGLAERRQRYGVGLGVLRLLVLDRGPRGRERQGVGVAGALPVGGVAGLDAVEGAQHLARGGRAVLEIALQKTGQGPAVTLAAGAGGAVVVPVELELHRSSSPLSVPGVDGIGRVDAAVLEVPLDGEPLPRGAAELLAAAGALLERVEDGLDHRLAIEPVGIERRALGEPLRA